MEGILSELLANKLYLNNPENVEVYFVEVQIENLDESFNLDSCFYLPSIIRIILTIILTHSVYIYMVLCFSSIICPMENANANTNNEEFSNN